MTTTKAKLRSTRTLNHQFRISVLAWLLFQVARLLAFTYRIQVIGGEHREAARSQHATGSFCLALWHEHLFGSILAHRQQKFAPLASLSADGELVTLVMDRFGFQTVRGSSSRGGEEARNDLVAITELGWFTAITMDGPRGPRRRVKGGVIDVARRSLVAILPLATVADRYWELNSWDRFKVPKPFARIVVAYGSPLIVSPQTQGLAFGQAKAKLKIAMDETEATALRALARE